MADYEEITLLRSILDAVGGTEVEVGDYERIQLLQGISDALNTSQARSRFIGQLLAITGDTRLLFIPDGSDTTTSVDQSRNQRTITHNATIASRLSRLGLGYSVAYDGATNYSSSVDAADLSFGDGSTDTAFSVVLLVRVTNTANNRVLCGKYVTNQREWWAYIATNDTLQFQLYDESSDGAETVSTNAAVPQDAWTSIILTYDGNEDSDGMIVYVNGLAVAVTRNSDVGATYTAMENGTSAFGIGAATSAATLPFQGDIALVDYAAGALTADQAWQIHNLLAGYFGFLG